MMTPARSHRRRTTRARLEAHNGHGRSLHHPFGAIHHRREPHVATLPSVPEGDDLLVAAADEVPPHHDLLNERLAAQQDQPTAMITAQHDRLAVSAEIKKLINLYSG